LLLVETSRQLPLSLVAELILNGTIADYFSRHKYTELPLIPEDAFLEEHPELRDADPHTLMLARLRHEKAVREQLEAERKQLLQKKQALVTEIKKRKDDLSRTGKAIERISGDFRALANTLGSSLGSI
jgi:THO complex subunit 5